jgi:hypothetical protein
MAINFPSSPTPGDIFTAGGTSWEWDGTVWKIPNVNELSSAGLVSTDGAGTLVSRVITAGSGITVVDGDGVSGNPTISATAVTSVDTSNGITGGPITSTGTVELTGQALALHNLATNGLVTRTGAGTVAGRTLTAGTGIAVTNGDGVSGNPSTALTGQALALHNLSTNGIIARTGSGTVAGRTITAGTGVSITNGDGVSGNPTITASGARLIQSKYVESTGSNTTTTTGIETGLVMPMSWTSSSNTRIIICTAVSTISATNASANGIYAVLDDATLSEIYFALDGSAGYGIRVQQVSTGAVSNSVTINFAFKLSSSAPLTEDYRLWHGTNAGSITTYFKSFLALEILP